MTAKLFKKIFLTVLSALVINGLLFFALGLMNLTPEEQSPSLSPNRVKREPIIEPKAASSSNEMEPLPKEREQNAPSEETEADIAPEIEFDSPIPQIEPIDVQTAALNAAVRMPDPQIPVARSDNKTEESGEVSVSDSDRQLSGPQDEEEVDTPPRLLNDPPPEYPRDAARRGIEGYVTVELLVNREGGVSRVRITERNGPPSFEESVKETVLADWRFEPGRHQNQVVPTWVKRRIYFRVQR